MMEYNQVIYKLGSLYSMLRELDAQGQYQGEHTLLFTGPDGTQRVVHVYIDGTEVQMSDSAPTGGEWRFSADISAGE